MDHPNHPMLLGLVVQPPPDGQGAPQADVPPFVTMGLLIAAPVALGALWKSRCIGPRTLAEHPRSIPVGVPPMTWFLAALSAWLITAIFATGAHELVRGPLHIDPKSVRGTGVTMAIYYSLGVALCAAAMVYLQDSSPRPAGRTRFGRPIDLLKGAIWLVAIYPLLHAVGMLSAAAAKAVWGAPVDPIAHSGLAGILEARDDPWVWAVIGAAVIGAPIVEEVIFRGLLQTGLVRVAPDRWIAVAGASMVFALQHASVVPVHALPSLLVLGLALGTLYERTGTILAPIGLHMAFNALNIALAWWLIPA